jgi:hypothetical protein
MSDSISGSGRLRFAEMDVSVSFLSEPLLLSDFAHVEFAGNDTMLLLNGGYNKTYNSGRSKILVYRDFTATANTDDNYIYFTMARYIEKTFRTYPTYPSK